MKRVQNWPKTDRFQSTIATTILVNNHIEAHNKYYLVAWEIQKKDEKHSSTKNKGSRRGITDKNNRRRERAAKREENATTPELIHLVQEHDGHPRSLLELSEDSPKRELDAKEQKANTAKRELDAKEQKVHAAIQRVDAAEQKVDTKKRKMEAADQKLNEVIQEVAQLSQEDGDPCLLELAKERLSVAKLVVAAAEDVMEAAKYGLEAATLFLQVELESLQRVIDSQCQEFGLEMFNAAFDAYVDTN